MFLEMMNRRLLLGGLKPKASMQARIVLLFPGNRALMQLMSGIVPMGTMDRTGLGATAQRSITMSLRTWLRCIVKLASHV